MESYEIPGFLIMSIGFVAIIFLFMILLAIAGVQLPTIPPWVLILLFLLPQAAALPYVYFKRRKGERIHMFASEDPEKNFKSGIGMLIQAAVQLFFLISSIFSTPTHFLEIFFAITFPFSAFYGVGLIVWSRIQIKRERSQPHESKIITSDYY